MQVYLTGRLMQCPAPQMSGFTEHSLISLKISKILGGETEIKISLLRVNHHFVFPDELIARYARKRQKVTTSKIKYQFI